MNHGLDLALQVGAKGNVGAQAVLAAHGRVADRLCCGRQALQALEVDVGNVAVGKGQLVVLTAPQLPRLRALVPVLRYARCCLLKCR